MLDINIADVYKVLDSIKFYIIGFAAIVILAIIAMIVCRKLSRAKKYMIRRQSVVAMILAFVLAVNLICAGPMAAIISLATGNGKISQRSVGEATKLAEDITREGIVMLKNDSGSLPLVKNSKLNVFGWASTNPIYGGSGSGSLSGKYPVVSLLQGLTDAGFSLNNELSDFYTTYMKARPKSKSTIMFGSDISLPEPPSNTYSKNLLDNAKKFSDTAVIVISRAGGEGKDLPTDMGAVIDGSWADGSTYLNTSYEENSKEYTDFKKGEHYLQLSQTEKNMVNLVCSNFNKVVVVYNGANTMEMGWVNEHKEIKSVLWCPGTGQSGFDALGEVLNGTVNPSGKTTDTFAYNLKEAPTWNNFGKFHYSNMSEYNTVNSYMGQKIADIKPSFIDYVEGIYVGYKYYETAAAEGSINYKKAVQYPFGYGLSYTSFQQKMGPLSEKNGEINFDVTVTNTGSVAGKDVVEAYYNPPYTNGGIEKSSVNLIAFRKTEMLKPGASQKVTISFKPEEMASYDTSNSGGYVLEQGSYVISINNDSHDVISSQTYNVPATVKYDDDNHRSTDQVAAKNQFGYAKGDFTYLSRKDHFANFAQATAAPATLAMPKEQKDAFLCTKNYDPKKDDDPKATMPTTGAKNGITLQQLRGKAYDDPLWNKLLDQMTVKDMDELISGGGYHTEPIASIGKERTVDCDGPASINNNFTKQGSIGFPSAVIIANTWNTDLAYAFGDSIGKMANEMGVSGWYAPAMNIHRSAFGGRDFEYYSEDGVLAGNIAASAVAGAQAHGVYAYIKHFALNEQETERSDMLCTWANEQSIREIYLKPFEICVKSGKTYAVMSSLNYIGPVYSAGSKSLLQSVLRDEWGFKGMVNTDYFSGYGYQNADQLVRNGNDLCLLSYDYPDAHVKDTSPSGVQAMRTSSHNILYTVVNSRAYDAKNLNAGMDGWQTAMIVIDVIVAAALLSVEFFVIRKGYKKRLTDPAAEQNENTL